MKLKVFHAKDGDCLMLSSSDGANVLIDGGRTDSFQQTTWRELQRLAKAEQAIDLLVVSHVDADRISGVLWLLNVVADWERYKHQIWHNSWRAQLGDLASEVENFAHALGTALLARPDGVDDDSDALVTARMIAQSIPQGVELRRVIDEATPIPRNNGFGELVLLEPASPHVECLGSMELTVLGPAKKHLNALKREWRAWLDDLAVPVVTPTTRVYASGDDPVGASLSALVAPLEQFVAASKIIEKTNPSKVSAPNRASITLLAEERGHTCCLLTGDAAEEELLEGLEAAGRLDKGPFHCDILKVQHHGSEHNLSKEFASAVLADHYVFCADGNHHNPEPSVVKTTIETRSNACPDPFTIWFNCSPERTLKSRRKSMAAAIAEAKRGLKGRGGCSVKVLSDQKPYLEIEV